MDAGAAAGWIVIVSVVAPVVAVVVWVARRFRLVRVGSPRGA